MNGIACLSLKKRNSEVYDPAAGFSHLNFKRCQRFNSRSLHSGEFPWACLLLTKNNTFLGACTIVPNLDDNDITRGTTKVITVAHRVHKFEANK